MGVPCYIEDFAFLIKYFSAKHYSFNRSTFCVLMKPVVSHYSIKIVHKPTFSEGGYFFVKTNIDICIITRVRK